MQSKEKGLNISAKSFVAAITVISAKGIVTNVQDFIVTLSHGLGL